MFGLCPWGTFGLIMHTLFLIIGIIVAVMVTRWAIRRGMVGEKYCIALLLAIVFATYACMNYDVKKLKCSCEASKTLK